MFASHPPPRREVQGTLSDADKYNLTVHTPDASGSFWRQKMSGIRLGDSRAERQRSEAQKSNLASLSYKVAKPDTNNHSSVATEAASDIQLADKSKARH